MTALLDVSGLSVGFGGVAALSGVDLTLDAGTLRCIIGPNGAGKSTFLKCLTGQVRARAGRIRLSGRDVTGWPTCARARAGIGLKTQVPSLFEALTVAEHCSLAGRGSDGAALLAELGLSGRADLAVARLSHGERQMVEIAAVLAARPRLVLLDEPTTGLTTDETRRVAEIVRGLGGRSSVIVVEHDMRFVAGLDCPVTVLHRGSTLAEGSYSGVMADAAVRAAYLGRQVETESCST